MSARAVHSANIYKDMFSNTGALTLVIFLHSRKRYLLRHVQLARETPAPEEGVIARCRDIGEIHVLERDTFAEGTFAHSRDFGKVHHVFERLASFECARTDGRDIGQVDRLERRGADGGLRDEEHLVADGGAQGKIDLCQRFAVDEAAASESRGRGERNLLEGVTSFEALGADGLDFFSAEAQQAVAGVHGHLLQLFHVGDVDLRQFGRIGEARLSGRLEFGQRDARRTSAVEEGAACLFERPQVAECPFADGLHLGKVNGAER